jgi:NADH-quinone oxidoreductase subunit E
MLTEKEKEETGEEIKLYPYRSAACIDALKIVQQHRGWISDEAINDVAAELGIPACEVDAVASFYTRLYRRPVGRNIILICDGISCMIMKYESLYEHISHRLNISWGETTADNRFTLLPISCLGDCSNAPAMMINNDHYQNLTTDMLDKILENYL